MDDPRFDEEQMTYLTESMTKTTSSIVMLVSAMFVDRIICKITQKNGKSVDQNTKQGSKLPPKIPSALLKNS